MINFINLNQSKPYNKFLESYNAAAEKNQKNIEAISISSFNHKLNEVDSRFVNLKYIIDNEWIFFSNYNSPKNSAFDSHQQISGLFFWQKTNTQIRLKGTIHKTSKHFNNEYFINRSSQKNALAISSDQSKPIDSYESVEANYYSSLESGNFKKCPDYWGGYSFTPYYFEFWEGHPARLNKRVSYLKVDQVWESLILQP